MTIFTVIIIILYISNSNSSRRAEVFFNTILVFSPVITTNWFI